MNLMREIDTLEGEIRQLEENEIKRKASVYF